MSKKQDRNKVIFGIFIIFLMVSSTLGFIYSGDSTTKKIDGHKFIRTDNGWRTYIESIESYWDFTYLPDEIEGASFNFNGNTVYLYSESEEKLYLDRFKFILLYGGVVGEIVDEKDCTSGAQTLVLVPSFSEPKITNDGNCIYLNGNINKFIDSLTYTIFGVI
jgi:hypothetical protein